MPRRRAVSSNRRAVRKREGTRREANPSLTPGGGVYDFGVSTLMPAATALQPSHPLGNSQDDALHPGVAESSRHLLDAELEKVG